MPKVYVLGVGLEGAESLSSQARGIVRRAELLVGGRRLLELFPESPAQKVPIGRDLGKVVALIDGARHDKRVVVLGTGDPNFYGIAARLLAALPKRALEILPNVSTMQWAFAKAKESWDDALLLSAHGRPIGEILDLISGTHKVGIFTDPKNSPSAIAEMLLQSGLRGYRACLFENLGEKGERISRLGLKALRRRSASPLNILLLLRDKGGPEGRALGPGIPDEAFESKGIPMTKEEVRAVSLSKLRLRSGDTLWDVGAGGGSLAIEASLLNPRGIVYAIERSPRRLGVLKRNARRLGAFSLKAISGEAPGALEGLPDPDAIFIGGSGGKLPSILRACARRLKPSGRLVLNAVTLGTLRQCLALMEEIGWQPYVTSLQVSRAEGEVQLLKGANPVFIISARGRLRAQAG